MKTQLFLDLQESGSTPAPTKPPPAAPAKPAAPSNPLATRSAPDDAAAPPPRPAVWQGPGAQRGGGDAALQRTDAGAMQRAPETAARGLGVAIESWADRAALSRPATPAGAPVMPQSRPDTGPQHLPGRPARQDVPEATQARVDVRPDPQDAPRPATPPHPRVDAVPEPFLDDTTVPRAPSADDDADWLAMRLRGEPAQQKAPPRNRLWKRRLATWSIAGGLIAAMAAGGLWLYEENRTDGALAVAPAPQPAAQPAATKDIVRPVAEVVAAPAVPAPSAPEAAADRAVKTVETTTVRTPEIEPPKRAPRQAATARKRPASKTPDAQTHATPSAPRAAAEPSARQRREETLLQCRAHGYDERQCFRHACTMTRYGFVCRG